MGSYESSMQAGEQLQMPIEVHARRVEFEETDSIQWILRDITEPVLNPLRRVLPQMGALDLAPLVAMVVLQIVGNLAESTLASMAYSLR